MMRHAARPPMLHLQTLNPYVASAFEGPGAQRPSCITRGAPAGLPLLAFAAGEGSAAARAAVGAAFGVSSFGAQGTNAHAILVQAPAQLSVQPAEDAAASLPGSQRSIWVKQQLWVHPEPQALLSEASLQGLPAGHFRVVFDCPLGLPRLAYLWQLTAGQAGQAQGTQLLSGSALLAAAASAVQLLALEQQLGADAAALLGDVVFSPPAALPSKPGRPGHAMPQLRVVVSLQGRLEVQVDGQQQALARVTWPRAKAGPKAELHSAGGDAAGADSAAASLLHAWWQPHVAAAVDAGQGSDPAACTAAVDSVAGHREGYAAGLTPALVEAGWQLAHLQRLKQHQGAAPEGKASSAVRSGAYHVTGVRAVAVSLSNAASLSAAAGSLPLTATAASAVAAPGSPSTGTLMVSAVTVGDGARGARLSEAALVPLGADALAAARDLGAGSVDAAEEAGVPAGPVLSAAVQPLLAMPDDERAMFLQVRLAPIHWLSVFQATCLQQWVSTFALTCV